MAVLFLPKRLGKLKQLFEVTIRRATTRIVVFDDGLESLGKVPPGPVLLQHLGELLFQKRPQVGDLDVLVVRLLELGLKFFEVDPTEIPRLASLLNLPPNQRLLRLLQGSPIHHQRLVQQLVHLGGRNFDPFLLHDAIDDSAQVLEHRDGPHHGLAQDLRFAGFEQSGDNVVQHRESLSPLILVQQRVRPLLEELQVLEGVFTFQRLGEVHSFFAAELLSLRDGLSQQFLQLGLVLHRGLIDTFRPLAVVLDGLFQPRQHAEEINNLAV